MIVFYGEVRTLNQQHDWDQYWMQQAMLLADKAAEQGEIPVGAVIVKDNQLLAQGWNQSISLSDPSAHAEMMAIRDAAKKIGNYRLPGMTLYVTLEPCCMCAGLLVHSRIERLVYGASDEKTGSINSIMQVTEHPKMNHRVEVEKGVLAEECGDKLSAFFKARRAQKKAAKLKACD